MATYNRKILIIIISILLLVSGCKTAPPEKPKGNSGENSEGPLVWEMIFAFGEEKTIAPMVEEIESNLNKHLEKDNIKVDIVGVSLESKGISFEEYLEQADFNNVDLLSIPGEEFSFRDKAVYTHPYQIISKKDLLVDLLPYINSDKGKEIKEVMGDLTLKSCIIDGKMYGLSTFPISFYAFSYDIKMVEEMGYKVEDIKGVIYDNEELFKKFKEAGKTPIAPLDRDIRNALGLFNLPLSNLVVFKDGQFTNLLDLPEYKSELVNRIHLKESGYMEKTPKPEEKYPVEAFREGALSDKPSTIGDKYIVPYAPNMSLYNGDAKTCIVQKDKVKPETYDFLKHIFTDSETVRIILGQVKDPNKHNMEDFIRKNTLSYWTNSLTQSTESGQRLKDFKENILKHNKDLPIGFRFNPEAVYTQILKTNGIYNPTQGVWDNSQKPDTTMAERILGLTSKDVDADIDKLKKQLVAAGLQEIIDEANKQYNSWKDKANEN